MKRLCTICARGGSKGVKGKNLRPLMGLPLIAHSIRQARAAGCFDVIAVSSDSEAILEAARIEGVDCLVRRPDALATDTAAKIPVIQHAVNEAEAWASTDFDICVDLDATSPLRAPEDILGAMALLEEDAANIVITAMPARRSPYFNMVELDSGTIPRLVKDSVGMVVRRQDAPLCYDMNASIYVWRRETLRTIGSLFTDATRLFIMPEERSIDIDSEIDFILVEQIMRLAHSEGKGLCG